ncbi:MAG TPA: glycoside hydrolase family 31 protein [Bacteroidales bacterium]|nr:glycoside hydrolase family 31 protein [Bacteroidales bacterium]HRW27017.1 glycoside hydrolase family 31 protein [Bacteroidales bacterium]
MKKTGILSTVALAAMFVTAILAGSCSGESYRRTDNGIIVKLNARSDFPGQTIRLQVINDRIIRVSAIPSGEFPETASLMTTPQSKGNAEFTIEKGEDNVVLSTSLLSAKVSLRTGEVSFTGNDGTVFLAEQEGGGRSFLPVMAMDETGYAVRQQFESYPDEAIYGLGANQTSFMNLKGRDADLFQYNTQAVVPFIVSNRNYGILWDNNSRTKYGDIREWNELSSMKLYDVEGAEGGLTAVYAGRKSSSEVFTTRTEKEISYQFIPDLVKFPEGFSLADGRVTWEGSFESDFSGVHKFMFNSAGYAKLWIDGKLLFDRWRQCWNASSNYFSLPLEQGRRYPVKIEWIPDGGESYIALRYLTPLDEEEQQRISFWSEVADQIDYYFISGESMDGVISGYRTLTGKVPVMPRWAMGFWQSRQRYTNQEELLSVVKEYRKRNIPFDNIVLDWQYWPIDKWGDHRFDSTRFPDPDGMIRTLHDDLNARIMISVWPKYYVGTENYEAMKNKGYLYMRNVEKERKDWIGYLSTFYDAFNADARKAFWDQINGALYSRGIDAWWLDATEPDITSNLPMAERKAMMHPTALGSADRYFNAYALVQAQGVFEGQRATDPGNRVFILTRSAFAGLQRYSAANWSGDIAARWHDMAAQIPCGLNFSMSGIPWWTMDIGGFSVESRYHNPSPEDLEEWRELMTRWHQYGAFVPLFRSHGEYPYREIFNTAPAGHPAYRTMVEYNRLRYRLMPYIYSLAGHAWLRDYTIMRGLTMDFSGDRAVFDIADQYMFGPSLMVCPVTEYRVRSRNVYLPAAYGWYDMRTGDHFAGGDEVNAEAPYGYMPVFIREGSVIPFGPEIRHTSEKTADPLTLWVYTGADGSFTLYEDEGDNYNYEDGAYSLISFTWSDNDHTLIIGAREGNYQGMPQERTINVVVVSEGQPVKLDFERTPDRSVNYTGEEIRLQFEN